MIGRSVEGSISFSLEFKFSMTELFLCTNVYFIKTPCDPITSISMFEH